MVLLGRQHFMILSTQSGQIRFWYEPQTNLTQLDLWTCLDIYIFFLIDCYNILRKKISHHIYIFLLLRFASKSGRFFFLCTFRHIKVFFFFFFFLVPFPPKCNQTRVNLLPFKFSFKFKNQSCFLKCKITN